MGRDQRQEPIKLMTEAFGVTVIVLLLGVLAAGWAGKTAGWTVCALAVGIVVAGACAQGVLGNFLDRLNTQISAGVGKKIAAAVGRYDVPVVHDLAWTVRTASLDGLDATVVTWRRGAEARHPENDRSAFAFIAAEQAFARMVLAWTRAERHALSLASPSAPRSALVTVLAGDWPSLVRTPADPTPSVTWTMAAAALERELAAYGQIAPSFCECLQGASASTPEADWPFATQSFFMASIEASSELSRTVDLQIHAQAERRRP